MKFTALALKRLIADRHPTESSEWALFFELRNGTGYAAERTQYVDAFAMHLWPTKKNWRVAYETKISRADFLRELTAPDKRSWGMEVANEFWFVCAPGVCKPEEVPEGCGLLEATKDGSTLKRLVVAPQRSARDLTLPETAALVRASTAKDRFSLKLWSHVGEEIDGDRLAELVDARLTEHQRQEISRQVELKVAEAHRNIANVLDGYAFHLEQGGLRAPEWMRNWTGDMSAGADTTLWARRVVYPGPALGPVNKTRRALKTLKSEVERAMTTLADADAHLAELMKHPASEQITPQPRDELDIG